MSKDPKPESAVVPIPSPDEPGVLRAGVDALNHAVTIDFDPRVISDEGVRRVAEKLAPIGHQHYCKAILRLDGRASGAAEQKLERKAQKIEGIRRARATFLGGVMTVTFDDARLSEAQVIERVREVGAPVTPYTPEIERKPANIREWAAHWTSGDRLEAVCMVLTFVFMITGWAAGAFAPALRGGLYVGAYLAGGYFGVRAGLQSLRQWTIDVDLLMVLAALGAAVVNAPFEGAMLLFLFSLSNVLQAYAIDRTRKAIKSLMKLRPEKALARRGGATVLLPVEELVVGDVLVVRPGESIALDSVIIEGRSAIDQSSLTGESMPVSKKAGDPVFAGTLNQTGGLEVRVTRLAKDSTIEKLVRMVEEAQTEKADAQRLLDRAEQYYAVGVILFTLGLIIVPILVRHQPFHAAFYRAMTVMVVASPCALIISTPASILSAIGGAARRGVLFKGGVHLERSATVKVVAFDKTGTLTEGKPRVTDLLVDGRLVDFRATPEPRRRRAARTGRFGRGKIRTPARAGDCHGVQTAPYARSMNAPRSNRSPAKARADWSADGGSPPGTLGISTALGIPVPAGFAGQIAALQDQGKTCVMVGETEESARRGQAPGSHRHRRRAAL